MRNVVVAYGPRGVFPKLILSMVLAIVGFQGQALVYGQSVDSVVATVNGRKITQLEVDQSVTAKLSPLQQQIYELRKAALENLILRIVLEDEAKKREISVEQLKRDLTAARVEVPKSEIEQYYAENILIFGTMSPDEARERLRLDLETKARMRNYRDALSKFRENAQVKSSLEEPVLPLGDMVGDAPFKGDNAAVVTVIEFSDFQCPFCKAAQATLQKLSLTYGDKVKFVFKHLPLDIHGDAFGAAKASVCAAEQGKFWQFHDALFASESLVSDTIDRMAAKLSLDSQKFRKCLDSPESETTVRKDMQDAHQFGIEGTPSFIVNGKLYRGALTFADFSAIIESKLTIAKAALSQP